MHDYLQRALGPAARILRIKTGNFGVKAQLCEALVRDVENRRLLVDKGELAEHLRHELSFFECHREVVGGVERIRYHGPQGGGEDDFDDCVISLALANWGRLHGWEGPQGETEDLQEYVDALDVLTEPGEPIPWQFRPPESGWMFPSSGHWQWPSGPGHEL